MSQPSGPLSGLYIHFPAQPNSEPVAPAPVPLLGVTVDAEITGSSARVTLAQRFKNTEARPIEAVYLFPLPTDAAVCAFEAEVDGRRVEGRVEEREKAFEIYDDALADGHGAFLMDQERPNVFTLSVGNLKAGSEAVIRISWVVTLAWEGEALRFQLPTTVSPRYTPRPNVVEIGQPDADKLNPERRHTVPYGLSLRLAVTDAVKRIESPTHPIRTTLAPVVVELSQDAVALDRDVVIIIEPAAARTPIAHVACDASGNRYVQVGFLPTFERTSEGAEVVFVVDCSGSMGGESIESARRALELCIRALDLRDHFDIMRFGSTFESLFGSARAFDDASLAAAVAFVRATDATLGGTEILAPLQSLVQRPFADKNNSMRQVLLLTDGQVSNENEVIELAKQHADTTRIFAFGIGAGVSEHLVREVARASRGEVEMIAPGERIEPKVLRQFGRVRSPALTDVRLDWGGLEVEQAPKVVPPVFEGELLTVWAKLRASAPAASNSMPRVILSGHGQSWAVPLELERATMGGPVPALWGRAAIRDLESSEAHHGSSQQRPGQADRKADRKNDKLIEIGKTLGLLSSATSYVAVEVRAEADKTTGPAELLRVPIALTAGWGGSAFNGAAAIHLRTFMAMAPAMQSAALPSFTGAPPAPGNAPQTPPARKSGGLLGAAAGVFKKSASRPAPPPPEQRASPAPSPTQAHHLPSEQAFRFRDSMFEDNARRGESGPIHFQERAKKKKVGDALYTLLLTQSANGSFPASPALMGLVRDMAAFKALVVTHGEALVATALVLALLARDHADRQSEWKAAADKAQRWLASQTPLAADALSQVL